MSADPRYGEIRRRDGRTTISYQRTLAHPPAKVWRAVTESEHMRWWMPVDMVGERFTGSVVQLTFWPDLVEKKGLDPDAGTATIRTWDPPRVFAWDWHGSLIRFELHPEPDDHCLLELTVAIDTEDPDTIVDNAGGYHLWIDHHVELLDTGHTTPIADADTGPHETAYRSIIAKS